MPDWPEDLPQSFVTNGYGGEIGDGRLRTSMDAGPPKMRRRSSAMPDRLTISFVATEEQFATFKEFVRADLLGGTLVFTMPDPRFAGTIDVTLGDRMPTWSDADPGHVMVSMDVEVIA